jgi:hypothetical protein
VEARTWAVVICVAMAPVAWAQTPATGTPCCEPDRSAGTSATPYAVQGSTPAQEASLRTQILIMQPEILPSRIVFVPHWQYVNAVRIYRLRVPTGMSSKMFTHLPSRTVYIDADLCGGDGWLGCWMAHELGHLARNSVKEDDAERAARGYRRRLKDARTRDPHSRSSN